MQSIPSRLVSKTMKTVYADDSIESVSEKVLCPYCLTSEGSAKYGSTWHGPAIAGSKCDSCGYTEGKGGGPDRIATPWAYKAVLRFKSAPPAGLPAGARYDKKSEMLRHLLRDKVCSVVRLHRVLMDLYDVGHEEATQMTRTLLRLWEGQGVMEFCTNS